jgi:Domain of unknown function (DUF4263)
MTNFTVRRTSATSSDVVGEIVLSETTTTRKIFKAQIVRKPETRSWMLSGELIHQRKTSRDQWEDKERLSLASLKAGDSAGISLDSEQMNNLIIAIDELRAVAETQGIRFGKRELVIADKDKVIPVADKERKRMIEKLVSADYGVEFWETLANARPDLVRKLSYAQVQLEREKQLQVFNNELQRLVWKEGEWEQFFYENQWIFGYGLKYQFLGILRRQANYGGATYERSGEQKGEFLANTLGAQRFTVIVEIKRPDTPLFQSDRYRSGVPGFSTEFVSAVSQAQVNSRTWDVEGSRRERDRAKLAAARINTISPQSILVIGCGDQLQDFDNRNSFELFRRDLRNPDIITFDC